VCACHCHTTAASSAWLSVLVNGRYIDTGDEQPAAYSIGARPHAWFGLTNVFQRIQPTDFTSDLIYYGLMKVMVRWFGFWEGMSGLGWAN